MSPENIIKQLERISSDRLHENPDLAKAAELAVGYVSRWIPAKVERGGNWDETRCPACGASLSSHLGDGIYEDRDWLEYCPNDECHQKLDWFYIPPKSGPRDC